METYDMDRLHTSQMHEHTDTDQKKSWTVYTLLKYYYTNSQKYRSKKKFEYMIFTTIRFSK